MQRAGVGNSGKSPEAGQHCQRLKRVKLRRRTPGDRGALGRREEPPRGPGACSNLTNPISVSFLLTYILRSHPHCVGESRTWVPCFMLGSSALWLRNLEKTQEIVNYCLCRNME
ncbi:hypothetical protein Y1Q_0001354 [Alligator mississippiensis]|uniref:Uncharacterized protein n=1 Tax=Alligator mississippiensis TaxID=8496 RepID=A0A151M953_ALLMI|nr:hypothetical protein Y1Q_0001354 [Alligator mississippiensis]